MPGHQQGPACCGVADSALETISHKVRHHVTQPRQAKRGPKTRESMCARSHVQCAQPLPSETAPPGKNPTSQQAKGPHTMNSPSPIPLRPPSPARQHGCLSNSYAQSSCPRDRHLPTIIHTKTHGMTCLEVRGRVTGDSRLAGAGTCQLCT